VDKGVALEYNGIAPKVLAKGRGDFLTKMLKIAEDNNITVYRDSDLAEILYDIDTGENIPEGLFKAVAVVMAHCYDVNLEFRRKIHKVDY